MTSSKYLEPGGPEASSTSKLPSYTGHYKTFGNSVLSTTRTFFSPQTPLLGSSAVTQHFSNLPGWVENFLPVHLNTEHWSFLLLVTYPTNFISQWRVSHQFSCYPWGSVPLQSFSETFFPLRHWGSCFTSLI